MARACGQRELDVVMRLPLLSVLFRSQPRPYGDPPPPPHPGRAFPRSRRVRTVLHMPAHSSPQPDLRQANSQLVLALHHGCTILVGVHSHGILASEGRCTCPRLRARSADLPQLAGHARPTASSLSLMRYLPILSRRRAAQVMATRAGIQEDECAAQPCWRGQSHKHWQANWVGRIVWGQRGRGPVRDLPARPRRRRKQEQ